MSGKQGKKAKHRQARGTGRGPAAAPARPAVDLAALATRIESALARGDVDAACQLLSQARPSQGGPSDRKLGARACALQAYQRWDKPPRAGRSLEQAIEWAPESAELHRLHAALLRRSGSTKRAVAEMAEASRLAPEDPHIAYETLLTRLAGGDRDGDLPGLAARVEGPPAQRAGTLLAAEGGDLASAERLLAASEQPVDRLILGVLLLAKGKAAEALPSLERVVAEERLPRTVQAYASFYLGIARMRLRQLAPAVEALERARALGMPEGQLLPQLVWVYQQFAIEAVLEGRLSAAADWFGKLAELSGPEAAEARDNAAYALGLLGQDRALKGDYDGAASAWSQALAITPGDTILRQNLAVALERAGRAAEAIPHWHELVRQMPRKAGAPPSGARVSTEEEELRRHVRAVAHRHLVDLYLEEDDVERAIDQLEKAVRAVPDDVENRRTLASLLMDEGQARKAAVHYQQVVAAIPGSAEDRLEFALALRATGEEQQGIEQMEKALELQPDNPAAQSSLGLALAERVSRSPGAANAIEDARRSVDLLPPKYADLGLIALGAAHLVRGERKEAQKSFRQAIKDAPIKAVAAVRVGEAHWRAGDHDAAVAAWTDAMKRAKRAPSAYADLARVWAMAGDVDRCRECLEKLMERPGGWLFALEAIESISRSRKLQPLVREVLRGMTGAADRLSEMVLLARMLVHAGDTRSASSLLSRAAIDAVEEDDKFVLEIILDLDMRYRLLDRKASRIVADYLDAHGYMDEVAL